MARRAESERSMTIRVSIGKEERTGVKTSVAQWLFLLFWMLKPFYFRPSGNMQLSDLVFMLSFGVWIVENGWRITADAKDRYFFLFLGGVFVVNGAYYLIYREREFLESCLFFLYNLFVVLEVRDFSRSRRFLRLLLWATAANLLTQLVLFRLGKGSYLFENLRFMGTFNDPNQFSFSMFSSFLLTVLLASFLKDQERADYKWWSAIALALAAYFIMLGNSAGMLLGLAAFAVAAPLLFLYSERTRAMLLLRFLSVAALLIALSFVLASGNPSRWIKLVFGEDSYFTVRLNEKLYYANHGGSMAFLSDRGLDKIIAYPRYLLYGAGEGLYSRFADSAFEVHSTLPGLLFCYGLIPFFFLCRWIWDNLRATSLTLLPLYLALLVESITLAHQRQPVFWMLILLAGLPFKDTGLRKYRFRTEL